MPISDKRLAANRANALKSTGPRTAIGKANSARNASRHLKLANSLLAESESSDRLIELLNAFRTDFQPTDHTEELFVEKMASAHWWLARLQTLETAALNYETRRQSGSTVDENSPTRAMLALRAIADKERHPDQLGRLRRRYEKEYYSAMNGLFFYRDKKRRDKKRPLRSHQLQQTKDSGLACEPTKPTLEATKSHPQPTRRTDEPTIKVVKPIEGPAA